MTNLVANSVPENPGNAIQILKQIVETRYGDKSLEIWRGDIVDLPVAQWVFSAFQGSYAPFGPNPWASVWKRRVQRSEYDYSPGYWGVPEPIAGNDAVVVLPTQEHFGQQYPLIVVHVLGSKIARNYSDNNWTPSLLALRRIYSELIFAFKELSTQGRLANDVGMPILASLLHGVPLETAVMIQKDFAEDALQTIAGLRRLIICGYGESATKQLLDSVRIILGRRACIGREDLEQWIVNSIDSLTKRLSDQTKVINDAQLIDEIRYLITQVTSNSIDLNNVANCARGILAQWIKIEMKKHGLKYNPKNMMQNIEDIGSKFMRPNSHICYLHSVRVLGNVGVHATDAAQGIRKEDIVTLLLGILSMFSLSNMPIQAK